MTLVSAGMALVGVARVDGGGDHNYKGGYMAIPAKYRSRHVRIRIEDDSRVYRSGRAEPQATVILEHAKDEYAPRLIVKYEPVMEPGLERVNVDATLPDDATFVDEETGKTMPIYPQWNTASYDIMEWGDGELARDIARRFGFWDFLGDCIGVGCHRRYENGEIRDEWKDAWDDAETVDDADDAEDGDGSGAEGAGEEDVNSGDAKSNGFHGRPHTEEQT